MRGILDDLQTILDTSSILEWIDEKAEQLAQLGTRPTGRIEFTPAILQARRISEIRPQRLPGQARIVPTQAGYRIDIQANLPPEVRRYRIAHELGHTYWFAPGGEGKPLSSAQVDPYWDLNIEFLCDRFAAALLLPRTEILQRLATQNCTQEPIITILNNIPELAARYQVPERIVTERMAFILFDRDSRILCVRQVPLRLQLSPKDAAPDSWNLSWYAIPDQLAGRKTAEGIKRQNSRSVSRRKIPVDMIPDWTSNETQQGLIDGRWYRLVAGQESETAVGPLSRQTKFPQRRGFARRVRDRIYVGLS